MLSLTIRRAVEDDLVALRNFHVANHLDETCHFPGEREHQTADLLDDFPQLYSLKAFNRGMFWVSTEDDDIIGCIGLTPDDDEPQTVTWLNTFSVSKDKRGRRVGSQLLQIALGAVQTSTVRLVTLGGHSEGKDIMGRARGVYEKYGFVLYRKVTVDYGVETTIDLLHYEKGMD